MMMNFWLFFCSVSYSMGLLAASGNVILIAKNVTLPFDDIEATFAPPIRRPGLCGRVSVAEPLDACSPLTNEIVSSMNSTRHPFVLIIRGGCSFEHKVRRAQAAGFQAAIVYDNETTDLVAMAGNPKGININAVFVTKVCGETLANYAGAAGMQLWIVPGNENPTRSIIALSFIPLLSMLAVSATCFFVRRHRFRTRTPLPPRAREMRGISSRLVKAMPSLIFTTVLEDNCTSQTCAICLEDYNVGEKLRVLPCLHKFHAVCVDTWLTSWRTFCPICKRDAKTKTSRPPASDSTPLLSSSSSTAAAASSSSSSSSSPPSLVSSPALHPKLTMPRAVDSTRTGDIQTNLAGSSSYQSRSVSQPGPISSSVYNHHSLQSRTNRSSVGQINASPLQPDGADYTSLSLINSRYILPYDQSLENASSPKS